MKDRHMIKNCPSHQSVVTVLMLCVFVATTSLTANVDLKAQDDVEENLIERLEGTIPYDEITVKAEDDTTEVIQLELLDIPGRRTPELKTTGKLEIRLLGNPDDIYEVFWRDVVNLGF